MRRDSISRGSVDIGSNISIEKYVLGSSERLPETSATTRFIFSIEPLLLQAQQQGDTKDYSLAERTAVKVAPGSPMSLEGRSGAEVYVVNLGFVQSEADYIDSVRSGHSDFFDALEGRARSEWDTVKDAPLDYIVEGEKNAERIVRADGVLIAPADSRFTHPRFNGWHLLYARGSRALSFGSDVLFGLREEEVLHRHKIITEVYFSIRGRLGLHIDGHRQDIGAGDVVIVDPEENHCMLDVVEAPYYGFTLQTPSIPGDRTVLEDF